MRLGKLAFALPGLLGAALLAILAAVILISLIWTPVDPLQVDLEATLAPPSWRHLLGTDEFGRDVLSRIMVGARVSVSLAAITVACAVTAGVAIGTLAGFLLGWTDRLLMTANDALLAFPGMLLALGMIAVVGPGAYGIVVALSLAYLPAVVRVVRGTVLSIRTRDYVTASRLMGNSEGYTMLRHVGPNAVPPVLVLATSMFGWVLLSESALSFLGVGVPPPTPTWGNMLASARPYLESSPWLSLAPGICISATLLAVNLVGDALRDRFDPRSQR